MSDPTIQDRAAGAIMGAFIGDALGLGPHWYYDLAALRRDYGDWITTYADPKPGRYHSGLKAGQLSQNGVILRLMLRSLIERGSYEETDFCRRMDEEILPSLNGMPVNGPGGYTQQSIRDAWRKRVQQNLPWGQTGGQADTTEAIGRTLALAVRYAFHPQESGHFVSPDALLTPSYVAAAAVDPDVRIEPAWKVSIVYGMTCAIYHQLPAAYHLTARFPNDFESAVLHAVNGGGENQSRAMLTGALVGAQTGLSGIPRRFLDGLDEGETLQQCAMNLASKVEASTTGVES